MVNVGIIGVTGYTGQELIRILLRHPQVNIAGLFSRSSFGKPINVLFPEFDGRLSLVCQSPEAENICRKCDLVFLALPHTASMKLAVKLAKKRIRIIDLSADYRIKDPKVYAKFYSVKHVDLGGLKRAVYGLPELNREKIKNAALVANPGCYPTAAILALAPLAYVKGMDLSSVIIDAKSGVSGAGKKIAESFLFSEANEDFKAYKVGVHQHAPEINQELSKMSKKKVEALFVPHLLPLNRGILETIYVRSNRRGTGISLVDLYAKFYKKEPFVRVRKGGDMPRLKDVVHSNFCDIGVKDLGKNIVLVSAIDNLLKGASGQAVQNMNIMCGFPERQGLL